MRPIRSLLIYLTFVFLGGALLAPLLYLSTRALAAHGWPFFEKIASNRFPRFVDRALLGAAVLGLWPLLNSCRMLNWRELGFKRGGRPWAGVVRGFVLGFGSLACVALFTISLGGRKLSAGHSGLEVFDCVCNATLTAVVVSILEEVLFRGALFGIISKAFSWPWALFVSSLVYALAHFIQKADPPQTVDWLSGLVLLPKMFHGETSLIPMALTLFVAGAILALGYEQTGTLFFSVGLHSGWIFWLKSYGFLTVSVPGADVSIWGSDKLIDGWLALPVLCCVLGIVWKTKLAGEKSN